MYKGKETQSFFSPCFRAHIRDGQKVLRVLGTSPGLFGISIVAKVIREKAKNGVLDKNMPQVEATYGERKATNRSAQSAERSRCPGTEPWYAVVHSFKRWKTFKGSMKIWKVTLIENKHQVGLVRATEEKQHLFLKSKNVSWTLDDWVLWNGLKIVWVRPSVRRELNRNWFKLCTLCFEANPYYSPIGKLLFRAVIQRERVTS